MKPNVEKLISSLKKRKQVENLSVYESDDEYWNYYFSINGFLNGKYFHLVFLNHKLTNEDEREVVENTTECIDEIKAIMSKFNL